MLYIKMNKFFQRCLLRKRKKKCLGTRPVKYKIFFLHCTCTSHVFYPYKCYKSQFENMEKDVLKEKMVIT